LKRFGLVVLLFWVSCKNPIEEKCNHICKFIQQCALEKNPAIKNFLEPKTLEKVQVQCLGSCTMFQEEFLFCETQSKGSCENYFQCILTLGVFN